MEGSKLGYKVWAMAIYLLTTNLKSVSSMKLHRNLDVCQKSAWFLAHRLREGWKIGGRSKWTRPTSAASARTCPTRSVADCRHGLHG